MGAAKDRGGDNPRNRSAYNRADGSHGIALRRGFSSHPDDATDFFLYESGPHFWQTHTETYTAFFGNYRRWRSRTDNANIIALVFATRTLLSLLASPYLSNPKLPSEPPTWRRARAQHMGFTPSSTTSELFVAWRSRRCGPTTSDSRGIIRSSGAQGWSIMDIDSNNGCEVME